MDSDNDKPIGLMISQAPEDPEEKKDWANQMARIQVAMWVDDDATCVYCGHRYSSVDDFLRCNPKRGYGKGFEFVCSGCWNKYEQETNQGKCLP